MTKSKTYRPTKRERMCLAAIKTYTKNGKWWLSSDEMIVMEKKLLDYGFAYEEIVKARTQAHIEGIF